MILGSEEIRRAMQAGLIICEPTPDRIEGSHIDVRLGENIWRLSTSRPLNLKTQKPADVFQLMNGPLVVFPARSFSLAHTEEFIGTVPGSRLVPILHTRSTLARWGLSVHLSAGWGDEGYVSRWTLEITNPHDVDVTLPAGSRVGCIVFQRIDGPAEPYSIGTRYNMDRQQWKPEHMLPRRGNW
jgi:dCTP deaminase